MEYIIIIQRITSAPAMRAHTQRSPRLSRHVPIYRKTPQHPTTPTHSPRNSHTMQSRATPSQTPAAASTAPAAARSLSLRSFWRKVRKHHTTRTRRNAIGLSSSRNTIQTCSALAIIRQTRIGWHRRISTARAHMERVLY